MAKGKYREGDWFAVPLRQGGFGVGLLARASGRHGVLLGYFFGPRRQAVPALADLVDLKPNGAALVTKFGHLGLAGGRWPILGRNPTWDRSEWPMPTFARYEELTGRTLKVFYRDDDPNQLVREEQVPATAAEGLPDDSMYGDGAVEIRLGQLLRSS